MQPWKKPEQKPDNQTLTVIAILLLIVLVPGTVDWLLQWWMLK